MRCSRLVLTALTLGAPLAVAGAQVFTVRDIGPATASYANGATPKIRRGMTSRVTIIKDFIDFVPFQMVSASGGATIGNFSNGRTNGGSGTGFIAMDVTVPANQATGSQITLNFPLDKWAFTVVHRGLVTSITPSPQPSTLQAGTPWVATVQGTDLGDPVSTLGTAQCHTATVGTRTNTSVQFTLTRQASCATSSFVLGLAPSATDDPPTYRLANGTIPILNFSYLPAGAACASDPNIGPPVVLQPTNGQVIVFGSGTASPTNVLIRWDSLTTGNRPAPNREWLVEKLVSGKQSPVFTTFPTVVVPAGVQPSTSRSFAIPGTHTFRVRAKNCGASAPATTVSFSTRY